MYNVITIRDEVFIEIIIICLLVIDFYTVIYVVLCVCIHSHEYLSYGCKNINVKMHELNLRHGESVIVVAIIFVHYVCIQIWSAH